MTPPRQSSQGPAADSPRPTTQPPALGVESSSPTRAVIYTRAADAVENARQVQVCRRRAERLGLFVIAEISDVTDRFRLSANRPGWALVIELIQSDSADVVICADFTRITSSWEDIPKLMALLRGTAGVITSGDVPRYEPATHEREIPRGLR